MSLLHHYYHPFFYNVHFTSPYDDVAPVFLQLTSIPARGENISQHNEMHRNNVTNQSIVTRSTDRSWVPILRDAVVDNPRWLEIRASVLFDSFEKRLYRRHGAFLLSH